MIELVAFNVESNQLNHQPHQRSAHFHCLHRESYYFGLHPRHVAKGAGGNLTFMAARSCVMFQDPART